MICLSFPTVLVPRKRLHHSGSVSLVTPSVLLIYLEALSSVLYRAATSTRAHTPPTLPALIIPSCQTHPELEVSPCPPSPRLYLPYLSFKNEQVFSFFSLRILLSDHL